MDFAVHGTEPLLRIATFGSRIRQAALSLVPLKVGRTFILLVNMWIGMRFSFKNDGTTGYIRSDLINVSNGTHYYVVANTNVQFRSAPSTSGTVRATIFSGESFPRRFNSGNWVFICKAIRSGHCREARRTCDDHTVCAAAAMDDQEVAVRIAPADNADMGIAGIKHQIARLGLAPRNIRAIAVLRGSSATAAG